MYIISSMKDKKLLLRVVLKLMGLTGLGFVVYILFAGFVSNDDKNIVYIDISKVREGKVEYFDVLNKKILVLHRTESMLEKLAYKKSEFFIAYAYDPIFGCAVEFFGEYFKSVCVDIKYDLAGQVYETNRSARNLIVPEHKLLESNQVMIWSN